MKNGTGLVAGQNFVDIVELKESGKKFVLEKSARIDIAEDGKPPSPDKRDELTQKAIRDAFKKSKAKSNNVVVGLAGSHAIVRRFRTVYVPKEQRQEAVKFEAQRYIPFKLDEIMSDFSVVAEAPDKNTMDALFIGANKNEVEKFTANFPKAGVKPSILSIEPMAIARLLKVCGAVEPDDNAAVVYVDEDRSGFIVMLKDQLPYLVRHVAFDPKKGSPFELMASNLKVSVDYFKRETKEPTVNKVVVCGDGKLLEFEMFLKQGLADSMGADISVFTMDNMKEHIENINELAARQQVAVGLAMLAFDPKDAAINILPHGGASTAAITADLSAYKPLAIEAAALAACLLALNFYMNSNAAALIKGAGTAVGGRFEVHSVPMSSDIGQINSAIAALNKKKAFMDLTVGNGRFYLTKKLGQLGNVLPVEAWIEKLEYINPIDSAPEILIDGMLFSEEKNEPVLASALLNRAKSNPVFSEHLERIEMGSLLRKNAYDKDLLTFKLTCRGDQGPYEALGKDFSMSRRR